LSAPPAGAGIRRTGCSTPAVPVHGLPVGCPGWTGAEIRNLERSMAARLPGLLDNAAPPTYPSSAAVGG
jgi:hypothetical protein